MNLNKLTLLKVHPVCLHSSIIVPWLLKIMRQLFVLILWNILCIHKFFSLILTVHDKSEACGIFYSTFIYKKLSKHWPLRRKNIAVLFLSPQRKKCPYQKITKSRMFPSLSIHDNVIFPTEKPASTLKNNKAVYSKTKDCAVFSNISQLKSLSWVSKYIHCLHINLTLLIWKIMPIKYVNGLHK